MAGIKRYPSYPECVSATLAQAGEPLTFAALMAKVAEMRPQTKGSRVAVYRAIEELYQAVPLEPYGGGVHESRRFGWLSNLLAGSTIRHSLEREEVRGGYVRLDELEHALLVPNFFQELEPAPRMLTISLFGGAQVSAEVNANRDVWALDIGNALVGWLDEQGAMSDDDLIIQVEDAADGSLRPASAARAKSATKTRSTLAIDNWRMRPRRLRLGLGASRTPSTHGTWWRVCWRMVTTRRCPPPTICTMCWPNIAVSKLWPAWATKLTLPVRNLRVRERLIRAP